ncbi:MAG: hypothetical protein ACKOSS_06280 [Planctomycetia bacterium]
MRAACLAAVVALVLLPLALVLLPQQPLVPAKGGPVLAQAAHDLSTAALDRVERLLGGHLHVRLELHGLRHDLEAVAALPPPPGAALPALPQPAARAGACERAL